MPTLLLETGAESRRIDPEELPLPLHDEGAGDPPTGLQPAAWIVTEESRLYVQPAEGQIVRCNGVELRSSQWLHDGDRIEIGRTLFLVSDRDRVVRLRLVREAVENVTAPPALSVHLDEETGDAPLTVRAVPYLPAGGNLSAARTRPRTRRWIGLAGLVLLVLGGSPLFFFRPVRIVIEPPPDRIRISGARLPTPGETWLLLPGEHELEAQRAGFRELRETLRVTRARTQSFAFSLEELPGVVRLEPGAVEDPEILVDGVPMPPGSPLQVELPAGEHRIEMRAEGFLPSSRSVLVRGGGQMQTEVFDLVRDSGLLTLRTLPDQAQVLVDGRPLGTTPFKRELTSGARTVTLRKPGYADWEQVLVLRAGEETSPPVIQLERSATVLAVRSDPEGADLLVDGTWRGNTPLDVRLDTPGTHVVQVTLTGYETAVREARVGEGEREQIHVTLRPVTGEISFVLLPPEAGLWIDGTPHESTGAVQLPVRAHDIEVRLDGYRPEHRTITPRAGIPQTVRVELTREKGARLPGSGSGAREALSSQGHRLLRFDGGTFQMGSSRREQGRRSNETLRDVSLTRPYLLAATETTNAQYREFDPSHRSGTIGGLSLMGDTHPVVSVSWEDTARYCNWLSEREGLDPVYDDRGGTLMVRSPLPDGYRLPTEAEWAFAARIAGRETPLRYPWGDAMPVPKNQGNYADARASSFLAQIVTGYDDGYPATAPVGSFPPDPQGLYDVGGNVSEWVLDVYEILPPVPRGIAVDPSGPVTGDLHVIRGSSFRDASITELRLSYRNYGREGRLDLGFRIARSAGENRDGGAP